MVLTVLSLNDDLKLTYEASPKYADARVDRTAKRPAMAKLIQIGASQNDLFGLDADGVVYRG